MAHPSIRGPRDFWAGILFATFGVAFGVLASTYAQGSATRMGPGYFPLALSMISTAIGLASIARSFLVDGPPVGQLALKKSVLVIGATLAFGLLLRGAGIGLTLAIVVLVSARASLRFRWLAALALAGGLAASSILLFVRLLGLPFPIIGSWLAG